MKAQTILTGAQCRWARRNELGISQQLLAKEAGVSRSYITNFEGGIFDPTDRIKEKLRRHFETKGVDLSQAPDSSDHAAAPQESQASARAIGPRTGRLRGPECIFVSGKLANESQRERILERIFTICDRLEEIGAEQATAGFLDLYDEKTDKLVAEGRALLAEIGVMYGRLFGREFAAVPTADMLSRKARPATVADALGLVFRDAFAALNIRRNSSRADAADEPRGDARSDPESEEPAEETEPEDQPAPAAAPAKPATAPFRMPGT